MKRSLAITIAVLCFAIALTFVECTHSVAGTGGGSTTTDNASVSGRVLYANGAAARGAAVRVRPAPYVRAIGPEPDSITRHDTTVNDSGWFYLDSLGIGQYRIEVNDNTSSASLLSCDIVTKKDSIVLPPDTLAAYQTINGKVDSALVGKPDLYVQVIGLNRIETVDSATGVFVIPDLAPGSYSLRIISTDTSVKPVVIDTAKTDTTHVPPISGLWTSTGGIYGGLVKSLVVAPSGSVLAGTPGSGIYKSDDNGATWTSASNGVTMQPGPVDSGFGVNSFLVIGNTIYAGTSNAGVFLSTDNGATWSAANNGMPAIGVNAMVAKNDTIVVGTDGGVLVSTDLAASWVLSSTGLTFPQVKTLALSPDGTNLYALLGDGELNLSHDAATTWSIAGFGNLALGSVYWMGTFGPMILAGSGNSIASSHDNGVSWALRDSVIPDFFTCAAMSTGSPYLYAGAVGDGMFRSSDTGSTFTAVNTGLSDSAGFPSFNTLCVTAAGATVYAATYDRGLFVTTDFGATWTQSSAGLQTVSVTGLAAFPNPTGGSYVLAATTGRTSSLSQNSGATWGTMGIGGINSLAAYKNANGGYDLFAGTGVKGIYHSTDNGAHWSQVNSGLTDSTIRVVAKSGALLFAGTVNAGAFRSSDNGSTWTPVNSGLTSVHVMSFAVDTFSAPGTARLYAGTTSGIFLSSDSGRSWTSLPGTAWTNGDIALAVCPSLGKAAVVFAGTWTSGLYMSIDTGRTWTNTGNGLPAANANIYALCVVSEATGPAVFAATGTGLYLTSDRGKNWSTFTTGMTHPALSSLAEGRDAAGQRCLFAGAFGNGVWKINLH
jgi:ligand-binding sensor domain-containing protein